jgi:hypothetical protein
MANNESPKGYIENLFDRAKEVPFDLVLDKLGLLDELRRVGDEIRGKCPICGGERSFSANPVKGQFNCFRCRKGGDVTDFVARFQQKANKEAALWLVSLIEPAEEVSDQETEVVDTVSSLVLNDREIRILHLMTKAYARILAAMFSYFPQSVAEQLERDAWEIVKDEIVREFPDTLFDVKGE